MVDGSRVLVNGECCIDVTLFGVLLRDLPVLVMEAVLPGVEVVLGVDVIHRVGEVSMTPVDHGLRVQPLKVLGAVSQVNPEVVIDGVDFRGTCIGMSVEHSDVLSFVAVKESESSEFICEGDSTLLLKNLHVQYPTTTGLNYKNDLTGGYRVCRVVDGVVHGPSKAGRLSPQRT